jgi:hypothetical protein
MSDAVWFWQRRDADGAVVEGTAPTFPTRSDAESWIGENWAELADEGVAAVVLFEGEREVYGPMSLEVG